jgi:hypothetical protein
MRKSAILGAIAALGASVPAFSANDLSYTYAEVGYITGESNGRDGDGVNLFGSLRLADMLHGFASYSEQSFDGNLDVDFTQAGLGINYPLTAMDSKVDLIGRFSYVSVDVSGPGFSKVTNNGYAFNFSLRTRLAGQYELSGGLNYQDLGQGNGDTSINAGARYYFMPNLAFGLDILQNDSDTMLILGLRADFGQY